MPIRRLTHSKHQKATVVLTFSGGIETEHWSEMG